MFLGITNELLNRAIAAARVRETQGYFARVAEGDQRAASLFVKLVACDLNPHGDTSDFGWLAKSPGESQVDGYAEDAIVFGADPSDRQNVIDLVNGAGAPDATIGGAVKERRANNHWVKPQALTATQLAYLTDGAPAVPVPVPAVVPWLPPGRSEALDELIWLHGFYMASDGLRRPKGLWRDDTIPPGPDFEGIAAWYLDTYQRARMAGQSREASRAAYVDRIRQSGEWQKLHPAER